MENHYKTLGVEFGASNEVIKQSYRRLAMKWHPDKNRYNPMAENTFKIVLRAYQVLSSSARAQYDLEYQRVFINAHQNTKKTNQPAKEAQTSKSNYSYQKAEFHNFSEPKKHTAYGTYDENGNVFDEFNRANNFKEQAKPKLKRMRIKVSLDFWSAVLGATKTYQVTDPDTLRNFSINVTFPSGVATGDVFVVKNILREIEVNVNVEKDDYFFRVNLDIHSHFELPFSVAVSGGVIKYPYHSGYLSLQIPVGFQNHQVLKINGMGVRKDDACGNLYLKGKVLIPTDITSQQEDLIYKFQQIESYKSKPSELYKHLHELWKKK